jgi:hypothetical protein
MADFPEKKGTTTRKAKLSIPNTETKKQAKHALVFPEDNFSTPEDLAKKKQNPCLKTMIIPELAKDVVSKEPKKERDIYACTLPIMVSKKETMKVWLEKYWLILLGGIASIAFMLWRIIF